METALDIQANPYDQFNDLEAPAASVNPYDQFEGLELEQASDEPGVAKHMLGKLAQGVASVPSGMVKATGLGINRPNQDLLSTYKANANNDPSLQRDLGPIDRIRSINFSMKSPDEQQAIIADMEDATRTAPERSELFKAGQEFDKWVGENTYNNTELEQADGLTGFFVNDVPQAFGSVLAFLGSSLATRGALKTTAPGMSAAESTIIGAGVPGAMNNYSGQFEKAVSDGATLDEAYETAEVSKYIGAAEGLPIFGFLERIDKASGGTIKNAIKNIAIQGTEEGLQEAGTEIANALTRYAVYDPDLGWKEAGEDAAHSGAVGFTTGAILETLAQTLLPGRRSPTATTSAPNPNMSEEVEAAPAALPAPEQINVPPTGPEQVAGNANNGMDGSFPYAIDLTGKATPQTIEAPQEEAEFNIDDQIQKLEQVVRQDQIEQSYAQKTALDEQATAIDPVQLAVDQAQPGPMAYQASRIAPKTEALTQKLEQQRQARLVQQHQNVQVPNNTMAEQLNKSGALNQAQVNDYLKRSEAERNKKQPHRERMRSINPKKDDILTAIAKAGGISREDAQAQGIDPAYFNKRAGILPVFTKKGNSFDGIAENLSQHGYFGSDEYSANGLLEKVSESLAGRLAYTPEGAARRAEDVYQENAPLEELNPSEHESSIGTLYGRALGLGVSSHALDEILESRNPDQIRFEIEAEIEELSREGQRATNDTPRASEAPSQRVDEKESFQTSNTNDLTDSDLSDAEIDQLFSGTSLADIKTARDKFALETQTENTLREKAEQEQAAKEAEKGKDAKAEADAQRNDFVLAGSNRDADQAAARGQNSLFDKPAPDKPAPAPAKKSKSLFDDQANEAATSPKNDLPQPTDAQKEAGNYKMAHVKVQGLDITLENPKGSKRSGVDPDGKKWSVTMANHYGYIKRTEGADGDHVDVFVGPNPESTKVFIVDQVNADGSFDEHKVLIGFDDQLKARHGYARNYQKGFKVGPITAMDMPAFKDWLKSDTTKPAQTPETPTATKRASSYGKNNKVFTEDAAAKARARLKAKLGQTNSGIDPEMIQDGLTLAGYHIESGARKFNDYAKAMIDDLGEGIRPYLRSFYESVRYYPDFDNSGMSAQDQIEETDNVPSTSKRVERDSEPGPTKKRVGQNSLFDEPEGNGDVSDKPVGEVDAGIRERSGDSVPKASPAPTGKRSNKRLHNTDGTIGTESSNAGTGDTGGSSKPRAKRSPTDTRTKQETDGVVERATELKESRSTKPTVQTIIDADLDNIRATVPQLLPEQHDDVVFAETRLLTNAGRGVMFTNGTGTGKTFTGLGTIKRYTLRGKSNILIVVPNDKIATDWAQSGRLFGLEIGRLANSKDNGTSGISITTYANFYQNSTLIDRDWDLLTFDESHYLMQSKDFNNTQYLDQMRAITGHKRGTSRYHYAKRRDIYDGVDQLRAQSKQLEVDLAAPNLSEYKKTQLQSQLAKVENQKDVMLKRADAFRQEDNENRPAHWLDKSTDVLFLSATPFAYRKSVDYAEGFLFDYTEGDNSSAYNAKDGRESFFVSNFGYRMRYNKLNEPSAEVDVALMEREFNTRLRATGAVRSRLLEVEKDYDRRFYLVADAIGERIDDGFQWIDNRRNELQEEQKAAGNEDMQSLIDGYSDLSQAIHKQFSYLRKAYLLESIKAKHIVPTIREHLALGRKVVVFHDYNKGGGFHPFQRSNILDSALAGNQSVDPDLSRISDAYDDFVENRPDLINLNFSELISPRDRFNKEFGEEALFISGLVSKGERRANISSFNEDNSGANLLVVQSDAGREGISMHDTSGAHQRVLINIGLPVKPIASIQTEGRIYRTFVQTDAIQRYVSTGLNMERWAVASKLAERASTAENLAMGEMARGLKESFINSYEEADTYTPGHEGEGQGGKALDRALAAITTPFERAKSYYFGKEKVSARRDQREGKDYFATPEPVGFKMVEWANLRPGDRALEPSAGHGAILRFIPENIDAHFIEPSSSLASSAQMNTHAKYHNGMFEDLHIVNKYDAIIMNPPFGSGGATARDHVAKAIRHLNDGGRIVALIPQGNAANKKFEALLESDLAHDVFTVADIDLPGVTFERAGTAVSTRILVLEKQSTDEGRAKIRSVNRSYANAETTKELFERIEHSEIPDRIIVEAVDPVPAQSAVTMPSNAMVAMDSAHTKTGDDLFVVNMTKDMGDNYATLNEAAKQHGGRYISAKMRHYYKPKDGSAVVGKPTFNFKTAEARQAFLAQAADTFSSLDTIVSADTKSLSPSQRLRNFAELGSDPANMPQTIADVSRMIGFVSPFDVVDSTEMNDDTPMRFNLDSRVVETNPNYEMTRAEAAQFMMEEVWHGIDAVNSNRTISASSMLFDPDSGAIYKEAQAHLSQEGPLADFLFYPLGEIFQQTFTPARTQAELFARLGVLYFGNPKQMQEHLPQAYEAYHGIVGRKENPVSGESVYNARWSRQSGQVRGQYRSEQATPANDRGRESAGREAGAVVSEGLAGIRQAVSRGIEGKSLGVHVQLDSSYLNAQLGSPDTVPASDFSQQNRLFRDEHKTLWYKAKLLAKRQLAPGGLLPDSIFQEKIKRDNELGAIEFDVVHLVGVLESAVKKDYGKSFDNLPKAEMKVLQDALTGNPNVSNIPEQTLTAIFAMRQHIDRMSAEYARDLQREIDELTALDDPAAEAKADMLNTIVGNMGTYVHRSYRAFDDAKWATTIPDAVLDTARRYLAAQYIERGESEREALRLAEVVMSEIVKNGTAYDDMVSFVRESKLGAKDLSVLKQRKVIAPEIRALLGEYEDPRVNYSKSATKMGRLVWNSRFLEKMKEIGIGSLFFEGTDRPANATVQLAGEQSDVYAPLNGMWTFPEVNQALVDALGKENMATWYRLVIQFNGMVKYGKTVLSPTTAARNWQSAMFFALANGHFDLRHAKTSVAGLKEYFNQNGDAGKLAYLRKLKQLGVVYDTPYAGEMIRLLSESKIDDVLESKSATLHKWFKSANQIATKAYQYGDDFWKIIGFENEKTALIKTGMTESAAEVEAAERIRNTYPTYSLTGRGVNWLRRFPLMGTFVSFPAEVIRTSSHILRYAYNDVTSSNPKMRRHGYSKLAGLAIASGAMYALQELTKSVLDMDDDDEEAVRLLAAPWEKNANILFMGHDENGDLRYFDMSFLDPYGYWKKPITAIMREQPWEDKATDVAKELLSPFLGQDIAAGAIYESFANKKSSGGAVYNEQADPITKTVAIADHLRKAIQPGIVSNIERTTNAIQGDYKKSGQQYDMSDEIMAWGGWRARTLDPKTAIYYRSFEFNDTKRASSQTLNSVLRDVNGASKAEIKTAYDRANKTLADAYREMNVLSTAAMKSGMKRGELIDVLARSKTGKEAIGAILKGEPLPLLISEQSAKDAFIKTRAVYGAEKAKLVRDNYQYAIQLAREALKDR